MPRQREALSSPSPRASPTSPHTPSARGEGHGGAVPSARGEGQPHAPSDPRSAPHPGPLPTEEWGEGTRAAPQGSVPFSPSVPAGEPDPAGTIWQDGAFRRDAWARPEAEVLLPDGLVILPKKRWLAERIRLASRNTPLGLQIEPGEAIDDIAADLARFALIALNFPKFNDGRAFSTARLLRDKHGFAGELRAVGNVLSDQIPFMRRVGFDSFEVKHLPTRRALAEGRIPEVKLYYQPSAAAEPPGGTRPWLRRGRS